MKKIATLLGVVALLSVLCAPVAAAITFHNFHQCTGRPCTGTNGKNHLDERYGAGVPDEIYGRGGPEILRASDYGRDHDVVRGQGGGNRLLTRDGDTKDLAAEGRRGLRARAGGLRRPAHEHLAIFLGGYHLKRSRTAIISAAESASATTAR